MIADRLKDTVTKNTKTLIFGPIFPPLGVVFGFYVLARGLYEQNRETVARGGIIAFIMSLVTVFQVLSSSLQSPIVRFLVLVGLMFCLFFSIRLILRRSGIYKETLDELRTKSSEHDAQSNSDSGVCDECGAVNDNFSKYCHNCTEKL